MLRNGRGPRGQSRSSALWGTGSNDDSRSNALWGKGGRGLVTAMGGRIWVASREGEGSPRILICGSLYLAGQVLRDNE